MAWTTPRTWIVGEKATHTLFNEQIKANLDYLAGLAVYRAMSGTLTATSASISITGWATAATAYQVLRLQAEYVRSDVAAATDMAAVYFNDDTGANYSSAWLWGSVDTAGSGDFINGTTIAMSQSCAGTLADANCYGHFDAWILQPNSTTIWKALTAISGVVHTTLNEYGLAQSNGIWKSTAAITKITIVPTLGLNLLAGLTWRLYGYL